MKNNFLNICIGTSIVICSCAFLIRSVNPAQAAPAPEDFQDAGTNKIGKYMMMVVPESEKYSEGIYVWDTQTGNSVRYIRSGTSFYKETGLPNNPLAE